MVFEKDVEAVLVREVKRLGGLCIKVGYSGLPDRLVLLPGGKVYFVELKRNDGRLSKLQEIWIARIKKCGVAVYVPKTKEAVIRIIQDGGDVK